MNQLVLTVLSKTVLNIKYSIELYWGQLKIQNYGSHHVEIIITNIKYKYTYFSNILLYLFFSILSAGIIYRTTKTSGSYSVGLYKIINNLNLKR